jgi:hypothetical protein
MQPHIETMTKLYRLSVDKAAKKGEVTNAKRQLTRLAKKHKVDLEAFIASIKPANNLKGMLNNISASMKADKKAAEPTTKKRSRRSLIVEHLQEGLWDIKTLSEALVNFGYPDVKANKKAVSGTMYDFTTNKGWFFRRDKETDRITVEIPA